MSELQGFTQLDDSLRREYGGNGLGLAIGQRLVEAMGGSIACSSEPNRGSTFTVILPLPLAPNDDHPPTASSAQGSPALGVAPLLPHDEEERDVLVEEQRPRRGGEENKLRVLLVEDNTVNQKVGVRMLESLGCEVDVAGNGLEAITAVERALGFFGGDGSEGHDDHTAAPATGDNGHHYDLILMDCQMPGNTLHAHTTIALGLRADVAVVRRCFILSVVDGFKATKRIRELERRRRVADEAAGRRKVVVRVPILAVTASATQKYEDKSYACDMDDFVAKVRRWSSTPPLRVVCGGVRTIPQLTVISPSLYPQPLNRSTLKAALARWTRRPAATRGTVRSEDDRQKGGIEEAEPVPRQVYIK